jgi:hypothetical protein
MLDRWFSVIKLPLSLKQCSSPPRRSLSGLNALGYWSPLLAGLKSDV